MLQNKIEQFGIVQINSEQNRTKPNTLLQKYFQNIKENLYMTKFIKYYDPTMLTKAELEALKKDMQEASALMSAELARLKAEGIPILMQEQNKETNE